MSSLLRWRRRLKGARCTASYSRGSGGGGGGSSSSSACTALCDAAHCATCTVQMLTVMCEGIKASVRGCSDCSPLLGGVVTRSCGNNRTKVREQQTKRQVPVWYHVSTFITVSPRLTRHAETVSNYSGSLLWLVTRRASAYAARHQPHSKLCSHNLTHRSVSQWGDIDNVTTNKDTTI